MNCQNCGGPMTPVPNRGYLTCRFCSTFHFPGAIDASGDRVTPLGMNGPLECPVCEESLSLGAVEDHHILYCGTCRGILTDAATFATVVQERRTEYRGTDAEPVPIDPREYGRKVMCPACRERMEVHPYYGPGSVVIDSCSRCRMVWVDAGELAAIEAGPGARPRRMEWVSYGGVGE